MQRDKPMQKNIANARGICYTGYNDIAAEPAKDTRRKIMGLIKAITGAAGGVLADQWKEFFYCEAI